MAVTVPSQIRIDQVVKTKSNKIFKNLGLDMSSAVNIFLNQCIINDGLPFLVQNHKINSRLQNTINEAYEVANSKTARGYHNVDDLFKDMGA